MLSATSSSISTFSGHPASLNDVGGRRSRLSNSHSLSSYTSSKSRHLAGRVSVATPTSTRYYPSTGAPFDEAVLLSGCTTPDTTAPENNVGNSSVSNPARRVHVSDQELCFRARQVSGALDFDVITDLGRNKWAWRENRREFTLFSMDAELERRHEVLAAGDLNCSIEEIESVLHLANVSEYNATMKRLLKKQFIYGAVVHSVGPEALSDSPATPGGGGSANRAIESSSSMASSVSVAGSSSTSSSSSSMSNYVAVKTSMFVRSNLFARNEEWCFLESFERSPTGDQFLMSQSTMDANELRAGKAQHSRVDQLRDVTTAIYVEKIPRSRSVRLFFHGKYDGGLHSFIETKNVTPPKAAKTRLMMLAKSTAHISDLVRRRRLGLQKMATRSAFSAARNTKCTCCTKALHLFTKKKRCFLCAYYVCDRCWSQQKMETCNGKTSAILICTRCLESVDACEYSDVCLRDPKQQQYLIRVEPDSHSARSGSSNDQQAEPTGKALVDILERSLTDSDDAIKNAAMSVIRHILKLDSSMLDMNEASYGKLPSMDSGSARAEYSGLQSERDHVEALTQSLESQPPMPLHECVLANTEQRNYPIRVPEHPATTAFEHPLPANEAQRLHAIRENNFLSLGEVTELNIICSLAAEELHCAISMITIIDDESELILSCNNADLHRTRMARNQTFCSHLIMDNKPLLIRNPEADVRFFNMDAVKTSGVKFYCGFPISAADGTIVGSVCCLDFQQRSLTQSQYSMMKKLAKTASKVIQAKGRSLSSSSRRTMGSSPP
ncbi:hypothetical protein Gpo141_00009520 [Globisporangium polare]